MQLTYSSSGGFLTRTLVLTLAVLIADRLLPGVEVTSNWAAIGTAIVIALLNNIVRPILIVITLPLTLLSMGVFLFVVNAIIILMASGLVGGFTVHGLGSAILLSIIITALNYVLEWFRKRADRHPYQERGTRMGDDHFDDYEEIQ